MKLLKKLIRLHKYLFLAAALFACLSVFTGLYWNNFLAEMIDNLGSIITFEGQNAVAALSKMLATAAFIIIFHTTNEYAAAYLASYACELSAHEMRMGYALFYLKSDVRMLSKLNAGEEQSAMLNELSELSAYLNEAFFSFIKQSLSFVSTIIFLSCKNFKLTILSVLPVIPLILYCSFSGKIIQCHTGQCLEKKKTLNGLTDTVIELFPIIQIYNAYRLTNDVINDHLLSWQEHNIRKERVSAGLMSLSGLLSFLPLLLLLGAGGFMVINGQITTGIFYIFINLSGNVSGFLQNMPNIYAGFRRFLASADRLEKKVQLQNTVH